MKPINSTIEIDFVNGKPGAFALVMHGWFSPARLDDCDAYYRCQSPDGVYWHVLSFGGDIGADKARHLVHEAFSGHTKTVGIDA